MPSIELACGVSAWEAAARALPHPVHREAGWLVVDGGGGVLVGCGRPAPVGAALGGGVG